jgi:hypothetical protein
MEGRPLPQPPPPSENVEAELLHTFTRVYTSDTLLLLVRVAVLTAVTLTVPIVLFPVSTPADQSGLRPAPSLWLKRRGRRRSAIASELV